MKKFKSLQILDKFKFIFEKFGINYSLMRKILELKLTMDNRRVPTALSNNKNKEQSEKNNNFSMTLLFYGFIGLINMVFMFMPMPVLPKMTFILGIIIFMVLTTFISDFSSVLLDVKDKNILLSKPIDIKTINASKIIHILIYIFSITMAIAGPSLIASFIKYGLLFGFVFFIELIFLNLLSILLTSLLYFFMLYFFDGEKLKDIINYFQIFLSIALAVGYQLMFRVFDFIDLKVAFTLKWWHGFIPSIWFAAPLSLIEDKTFNLYIILFTILSIVIPIISFIIYFKFAAPYFESSLQKLNNNSMKENIKLEKKLNRQRKLAGLFCKNKIENSVFIFTRNMSANERGFKLRIYPSLAMSIILPFIILLSLMKGSVSFNELLNSKLYFSLYLMILLLPLTILTIGTSEKYKGAWIYRVLPISEPTLIYRGAFIAFVTKYIYPLFILESILFLILWKFKIVLDVIVIFFILNILNIMVFRKMKKVLPFSTAPTTNNSDNIEITLLVMMSAGLLGGLHFGLTYVKYAIFIYAAILLLINIYLMKKSFKITWDEFFK